MPQDRSKGDDGYKEPEAEGIGLARSPSRQPDSRLRRKANGCDGGSTLLQSDGPTRKKERAREPESDAETDRVALLIKV